MNVHQRKEYVSNNSLCSLCLRPNHSPEECRGNFSCRVCKGTHNTLLHIDSGSGAASGNVSGTANVVATTTGSLSSNKLLMTCQVLATGPTGKAMPIRGLLDSGADISAVTTKVAKQLGLRKLGTTVSVSSYGDVMQPASPSVSLTIDSIHAKPWQAGIEAVVVDKITGTIPRSKATSVREHPCMQGLQLADPHFDLPGRVDLLLGVDVLPRVVFPLGLLEFGRPPWAIQSWGHIRTPPRQAVAAQLYCRLLCKLRVQVSPQMTWHSHGSGKWSSPPSKWPLFPKKSWLFKTSTVPHTLLM